DSSGTGNTANATGVTWTGGAASFAGSSSQQIAANGPVVDTSTSFSVSAWVNLKATSSSNQAGVSAESTTASAFYLMYDGGQNSCSSPPPPTDPPTPPPPTPSPPPPATTGTWSHLVGVFDSSSDIMTLYVNGSAQSTASDTTPFKATGPLVIGAAK